MFAILDFHIFKDFLCCANIIILHSWVEMADQGWKQYKDTHKSVYLMQPEKPILKSPTSRVFI